MSLIFIFYFIGYILASTRVVHTSFMSVFDRCDRSGLQTGESYIQYYIYVRARSYAYYAYELRDF